jgi:ubiquinone/menaquinone biosynthesis C-methylase UbiE
MSDVVAFPKRRRSVERIFAWFLGHSNKAMAKTYGKLKANMFTELKGTILEIGPGAGANFAFYPAGIHVIGVEPNPFMRPYLEKEAAGNGLDLTIVEGYAEDLQVPGASVDHVVCTLVLCSVFDPTAVLAEVHRVLKPGGKFFFIEHVAAAPGSWTRSIQERLTPAWRVVGDGCCPNRETWSTVESAGFRKVQLHHKIIRTPFKIIDTHIHGTATK